MSAWGQSRRFGREPITSGPPRRTDISGVCRHVSNVPILLQKSVEADHEP